MVLSAPSAYLADTLLRKKIFWSVNINLDLKTSTKSITVSKKNPQFSQKIRFSSNIYERAAAWFYAYSRVMMTTMVLFWCGIIFCCLENFVGSACGCIHLGKSIEKEHNFRSLNFSLVFFLYISKTFTLFFLET